MIAADHGKCARARFNWPLTMNAFIDELVITRAGRPV